MKIKVSASYTGVLPTAPYANARPGYSAEIETEIKESTIEPGHISKMQRDLQEICCRNFKHDESVALVERINREREDIRFYSLDDGTPVPSVTSILSVDKDWLIDAEKLRLLSAEGTLRHALIAHYISKGSMPEDSTRLENCVIENIICKKAGLVIKGDGFLNFLEKYPIESMKNGTKVISTEHRYGGTPDFWGTPKANEKEEIKPITTCFDVKRTPNVHENMMQIAAYIKASGLDCKQMIVVPINDKTKQQFSKPIVSQNVDKYFEAFLKKREQFKKRYGV